MCVPLLARDRVLGALNVYRNGADAAFADEEVELVERFATMAALAYDSARQRETLREQVKRDGLTGLLNHRACHERLRQELAGGGQVAVVLHRPRSLQGHQRRLRARRGRSRPGGDRGAAALGRARVRRRRAARRRGVRADPAGRRRRGRGGLRRARAGRAGRADRARAAAGGVGGRGGLAGRRRRARASCSRTATPRCTGPSAPGAGAPSATCRARSCPEAQQRNEIAALLERGTGGAAHGLPAGRRARHGPPGRLRGADAVRRRAAARAGRVVRAGASRRAGRGARGARAALRARRSPDRPEGTFLAVNVSPRALLSAPVRAALPADLTGHRGRADRARAVRRRGRARDRAGLAARARRAGRAG